MLFVKFRTVAEEKGRAIAATETEDKQFVNDTLTVLDFKVIEGQTSKSGIYMEVSCWRVPLCYSLSTFVFHLGGSSCPNNLRVR